MGIATEEYEHFPELNERCLCIIKFDFHYENILKNPNQLTILTRELAKDILEELNDIELSLVDCDEWVKKSWTEWNGFYQRDFFDMTNREFMHIMLPNYFINVGATSPDKRLVSDKKGEKLEVSVCNSMKDLQRVLKKMVSSEYIFPDEIKEFERFGRYVLDHGLHV